MMTQSLVLLSIKIKKIKLPTFKKEFGLVLEGYWIFLFPGKYAKVYTISEQRKALFYTWPLKAYLSLAAEWFVDSIWTEHPQPRAAKVEQSFSRNLSHQLLRVTSNTGKDPVCIQYAAFCLKRDGIWSKKLAIWHTMLCNASSSDFKALWKKLICA